MRGRVSQLEFVEFCERHEVDFADHALLNGRIVTTPKPGWAHSEVLARLACRVHDFLRRNGHVATRGGVEFPTGDTLGPDIAFIATSRWRKPRGRYARVVPDLVAEVLWPNTSSLDRGEKKAVYEANGVREYWLVDPRRQTIALFNLRDGRYGPPRVFRVGEQLQSEILPGLKFAVADIVGGS